MEHVEPDIFLCHNKADKPWVRELGARLEAESIDGTVSGRRIRVFLDEWDIEKGENIVSRLGKELSSGAFVAVVMSPEFFDSDWTRLEWTDVVARDPVNRVGRLLPLRRRDLSLDGSRRITFPAPFNALSYFDFRSDAHFEPVFEELLRRIRNLPPLRGRSVQPRHSSGIPERPRHSAGLEAAERVDEILVSNLAPLTTSPPPLYMANTTLRSLSELPSDAGFEAVSLAIRDKKLITFADLEDPGCSLNSVIDPYTIERIEFNQCVKKYDIANLWLTLANKDLAKALRKKGVSQDEKGRFYFLPAPGGKDRFVTVGTQQPREVAAKKRHHITNEEFWVHYCANIKFRLIASMPFLRILPTYSFTHDGVQSLDRKQAGRFRVMWGGKQDSATVLRQVLFWLLFMSDGHEEWVLETAGNPVPISVMPATAQTQFGIVIDHIRIKALVEESTGGELSGVADSAEIAISEERPTEDSDEAADGDDPL